MGLHSTDVINSVASTGIFPSVFPAVFSSRSFSPNNFSPMPFPQSALSHRCFIYHRYFPPKVYPVVFNVLESPQPFTSPKFFLYRLHRLDKKLKVRIKRKALISTYTSWSVEVENYNYLTRNSNEMLLPFPRVGIIWMNFKYKFVIVWLEVLEYIKCQRSYL